MHASGSGLKLYDGSGLKIFKCRLVPDALVLVGPPESNCFFFVVVFFFPQHLSYFLLSGPHRCFISVFVLIFYVLRDDALKS